MRGRYLAEGLYDYRRRPRLRPHADSGCALHIQDIHTNQKWVIRSFDKLFRQLLKLAMQSIRKRRARSTIGCRSARGRAVIGAVNGGTCVRHRGRHSQPLSLRSVRALLRCNPRSASCRTAVATSRSCGCSRAWRGFREAALQLTVCVRRCAPGFLCLENSICRMGWLLSIELAVTLRISTRGESKNSSGR
jgi:hypothetical protein